MVVVVIGGGIFGADFRLFNNVNQHGVVDTLLFTLRCEERKT